MVTDHQSPTPVTSHQSPVTAPFPADHRMKVIFTHPDFTRVGHCQAILEEAGIACFIRNESTQNLLAGLPDTAAQPVLCVTQDADAPRAMELLRDFTATEKQIESEENSAEWKCQHCGETVPGNFGSCWKCDALRPAQP